MRKAIKLAILALTLGLIGCQEKLDTISTDVKKDPNGVFLHMNTKTAVLKIPKSTEGGQVFTEIRMSGLANKDVQATISVVDFLEEYNKANNTRFRFLPISEYELYEVDNPTNISSNGNLTVTIKAGQIFEKVGVRVKPLNEKEYPIGVNYSIPLKITGTSAKQVLSEDKALISFERPFKTSVAEIKQGHAIVVKLAPEVEESEEITVQGQFMWKAWHAYAGSTMNMSVMGIGPYTRIFPDQLQVKDGGGDNPDDKAKYNFELNKWHQITFTCKDSYFKVYVDGKLIHTFQRTGVKLSKEMHIPIENPQTSYSTDRYFREFRLWNRALTEAEIAANVYLPIDPESEGLVAYLPINEDTKFEDKSKYNNEVIFRKGTGGTKGIQDGDSWHKDVKYDDFKVEWTKNVKFPSPEGHTGLYIEED
ncbi:BT_3987 domain-containing protein [Capnocytophaga cynodegmi]|uniref:BT-3987-like N-terminal domain-containing protein n=1 Tax=Capnocytophaga cynodegmi TaxID=28189 RepID=A0A0B7H3B5_9FLAO|nr:DUF1735 domain-containing protein [Capnocytophaga cynodegmi]CEN32427.1 conserved hypothetical protein [Capnocytophaga cynodegmi]